MVIVQAKIKNQNGSSSSLFLTKTDSGVYDWTTGEVYKVVTFPSVLDAYTFLANILYMYTNITELHIIQS